MVCRKVCCRIGCVAILIQYLRRHLMNARKEHLQQSSVEAPAMTRLEARPYATLVHSHGLSNAQQCMWVVD